MAESPSTSATPLIIKPMAETTVSRLPDRPLYWRIDRFFDAARDADPDALFVEDEEGTWRFTLGPQRHARWSGRLVATSGPVPKPAAAS